jgi:hypothetical protein
LACDLMDHLAKLPGVHLSSSSAVAEHSTSKGGSHFFLGCETPPSAARPTTFVLALSHVHWLTWRELQAIVAVSPTHRICAVWCENSLSQKVHVRVYYDAVPIDSRILQQFKPLPDAMRKKRQVEILWRESGVLHADDQARIGKLLDELYNARDWMDSNVLSWVDRVYSRDALHRLEPANAAGADDAAASTSDDAGATLPADSIVAFCVRVRGYPFISYAFLRHLSAMFGDRLGECFWIAPTTHTPASTSVGNATTMPIALQRARTAYGAVGESIVRGVLGAEGEAELAIVLATSASKATPVELQMHPGTAAPYQRAKRRHEARKHGSSANGTAAKRAKTDWE